MTENTVLIVDAFSPYHIEKLKANGFHVEYHPKLTPEEFISKIQQTQPVIIIVRSRKVQKVHFLSSKNLKAAIRAGAGYENIDVKTATELKITVCNTPGKNSVAVAELVFALILSLDRNLFANQLSLRNNIWNKQELSKSDGLKVF